MELLPVDVKFHLPFATVAAKGNNVSVDGQFRLDLGDRLDLRETPCSSNTSAATV